MKLLFYNKMNYYIISLTPPCMGNKKTATGINIFFIQPIRSQDNPTSAVKWKKRESVCVV